jgi:hypothetical protein
MSGSRPAFGHFGQFTSHSRHVAMACGMEASTCMKLEDEDQFPHGSFHHDTTLMRLERQLFAHIRELGDLRRLSGLEQIAYGVLADELDEDLALDISRLLVTQAVERVIHDDERDITSVPHGISRAERFAAFFEEGCPFCEAKVDLEPAEPEPDDDCACCAMVVREWRAQHADALRRSGRAGAALGGSSR